MECGACWLYMMWRYVEGRRARPLLGTFVEVSARAPDEAVLRRIFAVAFLAIGQVQRLMSRQDPASELSRLNQGAQQRRMTVHRWTGDVLRAARRFSEESEGAFDITLGAVGSWRDVEIDEAGGVRFLAPVTLDLGGIAKGFAVDRAVEAMQKAGAISGVVNAGGDLRVFGESAERISIRHPLAPGCSAGTVLLRERALATSAPYFAPALLNGRTGEQMLEEVSVTVGARDCLTADALTKITLVLREKAQFLLARHGADAFLLERSLPLRWFSRQDAP